MISFVTITDVTDDNIAVSRLDKAHSHDHPGGVEMTDFPDGGPLLRINRGFEIRVIRPCHSSPIQSVIESYQNVKGRKNNKAKVNSSLVSVSSTHILKLDPK
jgi:hypothetical protein